MRKFAILTFGLLLFSALPLLSQSLEGHWTGHVNLRGFPLELHFNFWEEPTGLMGWIDIPGQNVKEGKVDEIRAESDSAHFRFDGGPSYAYFGGAWEGDSLTGIMRQSGYAYHFSIARTGPGARPSYPPDSGATYTAEEVAFSNEENTFAGTLTLPQGKGPFPAVILVTGSGAQSRNEDLMGFPVFGRIAHFLSNAGYAVLRYDDRNTGCSSGTPIQESTLQDFASDALAAFRLLKARPEIDHQRIGILGHSEGGIVAPIAASLQPEIAFIILMAGTGVPGHEVLDKQTQLIYAVQGRSQSEIDEYLEESRETWDASQDPKKWAKLKQKEEKKLRKELKQMADAKRALILDEEEWVRTRLNAQFGVLECPWFQSFLGHDPAPVLRQVKCPVLLLFGEKDLQVPPSQSEQPMLEALEAGGNPDFKTVMILGANHLFQECITGNPAEYATLPKHFALGFQESILEWLSQHTSQH